MNITVDGRRPRGRPKTRWLDRIEEDKRLLNLTDDDAFNRRKWRNYTRFADPISDFLQDGIFRSISKQEGKQDKLA
ncbi:hypothetical protein ANCDUO_05466 [Ancylostoma duodenale]|uniref:Uncharacterized protein n=1 Tax=Ancylostoma duodenale TaxID=51022 RepID=A0A0C2GSF0_9BILA|nr:hypothetical protein ANCDUO_05466 [Ancylostoma duodenale]